MFRYLFSYKFNWNVRYFAWYWRSLLRKTKYREYFMESAGALYLRTSCCRIRKRTTERNERVRFLIQNNECVNTRTKKFLFGIVFIIYILRQSPVWDLFIVSLSKMPKFAATHREMTTKSKYQPLSEMFVKNITRVRIWGNPRMTSNLNNRLFWIHNWKWMNLGKMAGLNIK